MGILHADLNLAYLKISGVLGLGGGSADCGTFRKNEGEDVQRKSEGEGENRLLMVIWNIAPDPKTKASFLGGLLGEKAQFGKLKVCHPPGRGCHHQCSSYRTRSWCPEKVLLTWSLNWTLSQYFSKALFYN